MSWLAAAYAGCGEGTQYRRVISAREHQNARISSLSLLPAHAPRMARLAFRVIYLPTCQHRRYFDAPAPPQAPKWCRGWPEGLRRRGKHVLHKDKEISVGGRICQREGGGM